MRDKFNQFMYGRYGQDDLNRFLTMTALVNAVLSLFLFRSFFTTVTYALLIISIYRSLSRRFAERQSENQSYLRIKDKITDKVPFLKGKNRSGNSSQYNSGYRSSGYTGYTAPKDKTKKIFKCPQCKQKVRVPKGKGTIMITCPKCGNQFKKRT